MLRLFKTPKMLLVLTLLIISATIFLRQPSVELFIRFVLTLFIAVVSDILLVRFRKIESFFPSAAIVSGIIIFLLLPPDASILELFITVLIALSAKQFIRINKKHIFNPAVFGLFVGGLIFNHIVSWWGVAWQQLKLNNIPAIINFAILLLPFYVSAIKMRRLKIIASFLLIYNLYNYFFAGVLTIFDPTVIFFSFVMLPEPMTTPSNHKSQIIFGIFVALFAILVSYQSFIFIPDSLILALLVGNTVFFKWRKNEVV